VAFEQADIRAAKRLRDAVCQIFRSGSAVFRDGRADAVEKRLEYNWLYGFSSDGKGCCVLGMRVYDG
jgi:hypothetical protein